MDLSWALGPLRRKRTEREEEKVMQHDSAIVFSGARKRDQQFIARHM